MCTYKNLKNKTSRKQKLNKKLFTETITKSQLRRDYQWSMFDFSTAHDSTFGPIPF